MNTRFIIRLLTLSSWLPLAACASSDEDGAPEVEANAGDTEENGALNSDNAGNNSANANAENGNNLLGNENNEGNDNTDFGDDSDQESANVAANPGANVDGFENNVAADPFLDDPGAGANAAVAKNDGGIDAFKNTAIETNAFANGSESVITNGAPINAAPNAAQESAAPAPAAPPAPSPVAVAAVLSPAPLVPHDIEATPSSLHWVGYKINETLRKLDLEIVTKGRPEYEIFEQTNRIHQNELIIRFYHTSLRRKLHWDVNSSEFRSPVAYIRMKEKAAQGYVDLVITHRDAIEPMFYEKNGNFLLSYPIPDRYFGGHAKTDKKIKDRAVSLNPKADLPLAKAKVVSSAAPTVGIPRLQAYFKDAPKLEPIRKFIGLNKRIRSGKDGLPESFDKLRPIDKRTGSIVSRKTLVGVAQDDVDDDFADEPEAPINNATNNAAPKKGAKAAASNEAANANIQKASSSDGNLAPTNAADFGGNDAGASPIDTNPINAGGNEGGLDNELNNSPNSGTNGNAFSDLDDKPESGKPAKSKAASNIKAEAPLNAAPSDNLNAPMENIGSPDSGPVATEPFATQPSPPPIDVDPEAGSGKKQVYNGKPIFMDFYDSPLSLVLKSFQDATGNNFVFPSDVGSMTVSVAYKGVPWDEALRGILETYSLGMVRIGENVVRVDRITALSSYMQALETAKQFESRRVPTKVVIFRLNNAVAKDVSAKVGAMLAQDIAQDSRIKLSDDDRTNSVVIEAPTNILAKCKAIIERLDTETPQVEIVSRIVEVQKNQNNFFGVAWGNNLNFDPGRALGFGTLNFPNSFSSAFSVDPGVSSNTTAVSTGRFRLGSLNKFLDLDLLLRLEEKKGTSNVLQSNRVLVLDGQPARVTAGSSQFFRPPGGGNIINPAPGAGTGGGGEAAGLSEIKFDLSLDVTPQVTALGNVIMNLQIKSDTPGDQSGEVVASKSTRELKTQMVRASGDTGVIGGIYDTKRTSTVSGIPFLSDIPILGALFRSTSSTESQTELLIMVTPTIVSGPGDKKSEDSASENHVDTQVISVKNSKEKGTKL